MTQMLNVTHLSPAFGPVPNSRMRPMIRRSLIATLAASALIGSAYAPAFADSTLPQSVQGIVEVGSTIVLSGLSASFTLTGDPGDTVDDTVNYTVATNNVAGYTVTVTPTAPEFVGTGGVTDTIPMTDLIADDPTVPATPVALTGPTLVHTQNGRSVDVDGDDLTTTYSMEIPFVESGTYTATLNYIATTL